MKGGRLYEMMGKRAWEVIWRADWVIEKCKKARKKDIDMIDPPSDYQYMPEPHQHSLYVSSVTYQSPHEDY